jgi:hypothetical protein
VSEPITYRVASDPITYRVALHSLDSAAANYKFKNGEEHLTVSLSPDRFARMGRPGWVEVVVTPINGGLS